MVVLEIRFERAVIRNRAGVVADTVAGSSSDVSKFEATNRSESKSERTRRWLRIDAM